MQQILCSSVRVKAFLYSSVQVEKYVKIVDNILNIVYG